MTDVYYSHGRIENKGLSDRKRAIAVSSTVVFILSLFILNSNLSFLSLYVDNNEPDMAKSQILNDNVLTQTIKIGNYNDTS